MKVRFVHQAMLSIPLLCQSSICLAVESPDPNKSSKYLDAVRTFADNVLELGKKTCGPKYAPLFVNGLSKITGDRKYHQAPMEAIKYVYSVRSTA